MVRAKGVEPSLPREPDPKSGAVILNTFFPSKYAACFQFVPINLPTFSELPAQKPVRTAPTQTSLIRCSKLIPNRRRGGLSTPRAQFINNGFGLGEFLCKRGLMVLAVPPKCAVITDLLQNRLGHRLKCRHCRSGHTYCSPVNIHLIHPTL